ncbi:hypothetical protein A165_16770 [Vibrio tasmaniensis ZS-17]|nr:hypothetical protein A165_16770 [Vibrio tasmaniensis ZS-17]
MSTHQFQPDLPPPANTVGPVGWLRKNLFNGPVNSVVTVVLAYFAFTLLWAIADWAFINADCDHQAILSYRNYQATLSFA